ncbi:MAG: DUF1508 domain-containing protein [Hyphomicrobiales bacterium]|nr:MAG: DUF1508 domain-containing protein [Hyphomicrobiales bacterium]
MAAAYVLNKSGAQFYFTLRADNGETILVGERYTSKQSAQGGIDAVRANAGDDARYERKTAGKAHFVLKGANGEPLGHSEEYSSAAAMETGIAAVKKAGPTAPTEDRT